MNRRRRGEGGEREGSRRDSLEEDGEGRGGVKQLCSGYFSRNLSDVATFHLKLITL